MTWPRAKPWPTTTGRATRAAQRCRSARNCDRRAARAQALALLIQAGAVFPDRRLEGAVRDMFGLPQKDAAAPDPTPNQKSAPPPGTPVDGTGDDLNDPDLQEQQL